MRLVMIAVAFIFLGAFFIISNQNLHLADEVERTVFFKQYYVWLDKIIINSVQITGNAVKADWLPLDLNVSLNFSNSTKVGK